MAEKNTKAALAKAMKMYADGARIVDIETQTGVRRASLYFALGRAGKRANRNRRAGQNREQMSELSADHTREELLALLVQTQAQLAQTQARLDAVRAVINSDATGKKP